MTIAWLFFPLSTFVPNVIVVFPSKQINLHSWFSGRGIPLHHMWNSVCICGRAELDVHKDVHSWAIKEVAHFPAYDFCEKYALFNLVLISLFSCSASSDSSSLWPKGSCSHFQFFCGHQPISHPADTLPHAQTVYSKEAVGRGGRTQGHCQKQKSPVAYGLSTGGQDQ